MPPRQNPESSKNGVFEVFLEIQAEVLIRVSRTVSRSVFDDFEFLRVLKIFGFQVFCCFDFREFLQYSSVCWIYRFRILQRSVFISDETVVSESIRDDESFNILIVDSIYYEFLLIFLIGSRM